MEYLKLLINQFNQSKGYEKYDLNSNIYLDEFCEWIIELRKNLNNYFNFINTVGIDNDSLIVFKIDTKTKELVWNIQIESRWFV